MLYGFEGKAQFLQCFMHTLSTFLISFGHIITQQSPFTNVD